MRIYKHALFKCVLKYVCSVCVCLKCSTFKPKTHVWNVIVAGLASLQRKCLALTMLSPEMHCRLLPSGRVPSPGSDAKFGRFSFGPFATQEGGRKGEERGERARERGCRFVCSCTLSLYRFEWVCLCVFSLWEEDLKGMQLFLYTCPPPWGTSRACWKQTHIHLSHTHTERLWNERKYQTTLAEYLSRLKAAH